MKAIIGVDGQELYRTALNLMARTQIPGLEVNLVFAEEPPPALGIAPYLDPSVVTAEEALGEAATCFLERAKKACAALGIEAATSYHLGTPASVLMEQAEQKHGALIAIGSTRKSRYGAFFLGSIGRALTIGARQSVLIGKGKVAPVGKLTAVLATDHSEYGNECIRLLARWKPAGFERVVVVTATELAAADPLEVIGEHVYGENRELLQHFQSRGRSIAEHLTEQGIPAEYRLVQGPVHEVIAATMAEMAADLLILGAHGHGMFERLMVGSNSMHEALATPHSILLLRA
jgi:nucleotide-binding universal stress UspA family protein